jgi:pyruvate dehydrogenase E1 component
LDGPVRGNGRSSRNWKPTSAARLERDQGHLGQRLGPLAPTPDGLLVKRMGECVDGEFQKYSTEDGAYIRQHFFGKYPETLKLVEHLSDEQLTKAAPGRPRPGEGLRRLPCAR